MSGGDDDDLRTGPSKKRKTLQNAEKSWARENKPIRDEQAGSTIFRVTKKEADPRLAPKLNKDSVNRKKHLLVRNRSLSRPGGGGFFMKKR
jgi:hypothetical protein